MQQIELELAGGGVLTVSLRASLDAMPAVKQRPLVLVVPGGGYNHVSPREGDPVALQFAAAGYHTAVLTYSVGEGAQNYQPLRQLNEALALLRQNAASQRADIWLCPPRCWTFRARRPSRGPMQ